MIDLNEMVCFAHVVDQGSFAAAARRLRIPPSTMSRTIAALERRLGARLLERTTRKLRLTDAGAQYHERCRRIVAEAEEADRLMEARASRAQGTVRVSVPEAFVERLLAPAVTRLLATYPDVRVECLTDDRYVDLVGERMFAVTPSARAAPAHVRVFLDLLYEHVRQHPRLLDAAA
ncbi:hypothetical protein BE04_43470 [Sorangium cellulosum]|uniref:HTH lysR-type domain-containing protein n=2 Tax=Sorangium cellulosum TaxID=56 RepID=A0A150PY42_SORCE|nr:LysR family transcriptional regulator [Sorangium cellulosum]AGP38568.1 hypothetical protein SCE1572_31290 [Sorangium cellulosum So0157-2]KYF60705.1 hypothetical protein BE04_43470 [Sorangium cellulosum]